MLIISAARLKLLEPRQKMKRRRFTGQVMAVTVKGSERTII